MAEHLVESISIMNECIKTRGPKLCATVSGTFVIARPRGLRTMEATNNGDATNNEGIIVQ